MKPTSTILRCVLSVAVVAGAAPLCSCVRSTINLDPDNTSSQIVRAAALADKAQDAEKDGDKDKAIQLYQQAVAAYTDFHPAWNNLGVLLMEKEIYAPAAEAFRRAGELAPLDPRPLTNLGLIYLHRGYDRQASDYFTQALARDNGHVIALRESVRLDVQTDRITDVTAARLTKVLLLETDQRWVEQLRRYKVQVDQRLADAKEPLAS